MYICELLVTLSLGRLRATADSDHYGRNGRYHLLQLSLSLSLSLAHAHTHTHTQIHTHSHTRTKRQVAPTTSRPLLGVLCIKDAANVKVLDPAEAGHFLNMPQCELSMRHRLPAPTPPLGAVSLCGGVCRLGLVWVLVWMCG